MVVPLSYLNHHCCGRGAPCASNQQCGTDRQRHVDRKSSRSLRRKDTTFARWLQDPGSLCEGASAAEVSARLCAYGKTQGYQREHVEWDARGAGRRLLHASKDTTVASERGSRHFATNVGGSLWAITSGPWVAPVVVSTMQTPEPARRPNSHLVTVTSDSRKLKRHKALSVKAKSDLVAAAQHIREPEAELKVSGQCCVSPPAHLQAITLPSSFRVLLQRLRALLAVSSSASPATGAEVVVHTAPVHCRGGSCR